MKLMVKSAKELLQVLDETQKTSSRTENAPIPTPNGNTKESKLKSISTASQNISMKRF